MEKPNIPISEMLMARWRRERVFRALPTAMVGVIGAMLLGLVAILVIPSSGGLGVLAACAVVGIWLAALGWLGIRYYCRPSAQQLAARADWVLGMPDQLLHLASEHREEAEQWVQSSRAQAERSLKEVDLSASWPVRLRRRDAGLELLAVALTISFLWVGMHRGALGAAEESRIAEERAARAAVVDEMFDDWEEFVAETEDPELKELFSEALRLREEMEQADLAEAMMLLHKAEKSMQSLADALAAESMAAHAPDMAEAFDAIQGMGALAAALRQQNFETAAAEAEKLAKKLGENPDGTSAVQRSQAVSEMLASTASEAAQRGNQSLSDALQNLSECAASGQGKISNRDLKNATQSLSQSLDREAQRQRQGRSLATGRAQLDAMRDRLAGAPNEPKDGMPFPSLCQGSGSDPGGKEAGTGSGGDPIGAPTELAGPGVQESLTGLAGDGESETRVTRDTTGSAGGISESRQAEVSNFEELSRQAVADESLPLAHRQAIRSYFERIRPIAQDP